MYCELQSYVLQYMYTHMHVYVYAYVYIFWVGLHLISDWISFSLVAISAGLM